MKKFRKFRKVLALATALIIGIAALSACQTSTSTSGNAGNGTNSNASTDGSADGSSTSNNSTSNNSNDNTQVKKIGVVQFADHPSLKNCYDGLLEGLKAQGYEVGKNLEVDYQVGQAKMDLTNQIVQSFVSKNYDLIVGIATPAAQAAYNAASVKGIPVVFSAVTDPIIAELQNADGSNKPGVTGTSDVLPVDDQLKMIRAFLPEAKTIGIMYTTSETNSESAIKTYQELASKYNFEIVTQGIAEAKDIPAAATSLVGKVDVLSNLTDNTVVQNQQVVLAKANEKGIPYFGSEEEQVADGLVAAAGLDYIDLGKTNGEQAAQILAGTKAEDIKIAYTEASKPFYNSIELAALGLTLPDSYKDATDMAK